MPEEAGNAARHRRGPAIVVATPIATASAGEDTTAAQDRGEVARIVAAHDAAIKARDAHAAAAVHAKDAKLFAAGGVVVTGRPALLTLYIVFRSRNTIFVKSELTAPSLAELYFSTDGLSSVAAASRTRSRRSTSPSCNLRDPETKRTPSPSLRAMAAGPLPRRLRALVLRGACRPGPRARRTPSPARRRTGTT